MSWFFNKNRCKHKFGKVETTDYQYCELCGFANFVPRKCEHIYEKENTKLIEVVERHAYSPNSTVIKSIIVDRCKKCGRQRITTINTDNPTKFEFNDG